MSSPQVCAGAMLQCSFGAAPATLNVLPTNRTLVGGVPAATVADSIPIVNITPFGMCQSAANPTVIAATAAALGVFTPMPCVPATTTPWVPGGSPTLLIGSMPALNAQGMLMCMWGGVIKVAQPGQTSTLAP
ncbi:DUF4280 domain-containing protein [Paraburkholderia edwinii]|jgi:hypothetical protein|uniref:DUF4280 domain-containing protein n=1 Tax=Paraburkholderia edwinii TaxID=2861782 RepID=A0ABX8UXA9_9BURK|nr:DUF4280 domain-containing protein [Paraburkholderia edwinii]QYD71604.1 DUF4280 domain-containing protein [Paraburkholderia edwinii]